MVKAIPLFPIGEKVVGAADTGELNNDDSLMSAPICQLTTRSDTKVVHTEHTKNEYVLLDGVSLSQWDMCDIR